MQRYLVKLECHLLILLCSYKGISPIVGEASTVCYVLMPLALLLHTSAVAPITCHVFIVLFHSLGRGGCIVYIFICILVPISMLLFFSIPLDPGCENHILPMFQSSCANVVNYTNVSPVRQAPDGTASSAGLS